MKKICATILLLIGSLSIYSQGFPINTRYVGDINLGYGSPSKGNYNQRVSIGTIQGFELNQYLQFGIGLDINMYTHYYKNVEPFKSADLSGFRMSMQEFFDIRGMYPINQNWQLNLDLGLGVTHGVLHMGKPIQAAFFCQFGPGFKYKDKLGVNLGLQNHGTGEGTTTFFLKIAYCFTSKSKNYNF